MSDPVRKEIRSLTGLRGVAAVFVVFYHFLASRHFGGPVTNLLLHGYLAVDLFFVLSGFVMALSYRHMFAAGFSGPAYRTFLGRRLARVYPLYLAATLVAFGLVAARLLPFRFQGSLGGLLLENVLLVQTWGLNASLIFPGWSISAEWAAYLLFPLLLLPALSRKTWAAWVAGSTAVLVLLALCAVPATLGNKQPAEAVLNLGDLNYGFAVYRCLAEFTLGLLAFRVTRGRLGKMLASSRWAGTAIAAGILLLMCFPRTDLAVALLFPLLILTLAGERQLASRVLETPPAQFLGRISYSIYLVHGFFTLPVNALASRLTAHDIGHTQTLATAVGLVLTLGVATAAYHALEVPGRHWARGWLEGPRADRPLARAEDLRAEPGEF